MLLEISWKGWARRIRASCPVCDLGGGTSVWKPSDQIFRTESMHAHGGHAWGGGWLLNPLRPCHARRAASPRPARRTRGRPVLPCISTAQDATASTPPAHARGGAGTRQGRLLETFRVGRRHTPAIAIPPSRVRPSVRPSVLSCHPRPRQKRMVPNTTRPCHAGPGLERDTQHTPTNRNRFRGSYEIERRFEIAMRLKCVLQPPPLATRLQNAASTA